MNEVSICPGLPLVANPLTPEVRKKREHECVESLSESNSNRMYPDNHLEMIFHLEKKGDNNVLMVEAKKEYRNNFEGMRRYEKKLEVMRPFLEILWYIQILCFYV